MPMFLRMLMKTILLPQLLSMETLFRFKLVFVLQMPIMREILLAFKRGRKMFRQDTITTFLFIFQI